MHSFTKLLLVCCHLTVTLSLDERVGILADSKDFCYDTSKSVSCGQANWDGECNTGTRQSPIRLSQNSYGVTPSIQLNLKQYQASSFVLHNAKNTVSIKFSESNSSAPALTVKQQSFSSQSTSYVFDSAHFHWGNESNQGSEHCFKDRCLAMELHLVHYQNKFQNLNAAATSNESTAVAVLGILFDSSGKGKAMDDRESLNIIYKNLNQVENYNQSYTVDSSINFGTILKQYTSHSYQSNVFNYQGSLTTPGCAQTVNWFVFDTPVKVSRDNVKKFQQLKDAQNQPIVLNYRELQNSNGRKITKASASSS